MRNYFRKKAKKNNTGKQKEKRIRKTGAARLQVASIAAGTGTENRRRRRCMDQTGHNEGHANGSGAAPRRSRTRTDTRSTHAPTHAPGTPV